MSAVNPSGWQPSMGAASDHADDVVTSSGDRGLLLEEPLSFEIGSAGKCGVDLDEPDVDDGADEITERSLGRENSDAESVPNSVPNNDVPRDKPPT